MNDLVIGTVDLIDIAIAQFRGNGVESFDLGLGLNLIEWVTMGRVSDPKAVNGECAVTIFKGIIDITILVVTVFQIPVSNGSLVSRAYS